MKKGKRNTIGLTLFVCAVLTILLLVGAEGGALAQSQRNPCGTLRAPYAIQSGIPLYVQFSSSSQKCYYRFAGDAGDRVTISMELISGRVDPYLVLYRTSVSPARYVDENDDMSRYSRDSLIDLRLPVDQTYWIEASSYGGGTGYASLEMTLLPSTPARSWSPSR